MALFRIRATGLARRGSGAPMSADPKSASQLCQRGEEVAMYIGLGTIVLIVLVVVVFRMLSGRRV